MHTPTERRDMLLAMRADIMTRLEAAQADLEAVDRLISVQEEIGPPVVAASVEEVRLAAIGILEEVRRPMHRQNLLDELENRNVHVGGKVPVNNLGSILSRFDVDFKSHGQGIWSLKSWDLKPQPPSPKSTDSDGSLRKPETVPESLESAKRQESEPTVDLGDLPW